MIKNLEIPEFEIEGLIQTLKEMGIKGLMNWSDVLVLNHIQERGFVPTEKEQLIKVLKENTDMEYKDIMNLLQRYDQWKQVLPSYSLGLNQKLDSVNKRYNSVVPFRWIGNGPTRKLIGFVEEGNSINVYDGIGKHLMKLGSVDKKSWSINWGTHSLLQQEHSSYITSSVRELKNRNWL